MNNTHDNKAFVRALISDLRDLADFVDAIYGTEPDFEKSLEPRTELIQRVADSMFGFVITAETAPGLRRAIDVDWDSFVDTVCVEPAPRTHDVEVSHLADMIADVITEELDAEIRNVVTGRLGVECSFYERAHRDEYNRVVLDALPSVAAQFRGCLNTPDDDSE